MASEHLKGSYTTIPNNFLDNLEKFTVYEQSVLLFIMRQNLGQEKPNKLFAYSYISNNTGISPASAKRAVKSLLSRNVLISKGVNKLGIYRLDLNINRGLTDLGLTDRGLTDLGVWSDRPVGEVSQTYSKRKHIKENNNKENIIALPVKKPAKPKDENILIKRFVKEQYKLAYTELTGQEYQAAGKKSIANNVSIKSVIKFTQDETIIKQKLRLLLNKCQNDNFWRDKFTLQSLVSQWANLYEEKKATPQKQEINIKMDIDELWPISLPAWENSDKSESTLRKLLETQHKAANR